MNLPDRDTLTATDLIYIAENIGIELPLSKQSIGRINRGWHMYRGASHEAHSLDGIRLVASLGPKLTSKSLTYYTVDKDSCTCMDFITRGKYCKHQIYIVLRDYQTVGVAPPSDAPTRHRRIRL